MYCAPVNTISMYAGLYCTQLNECQITILGQTYVSCQIPLPLDACQIPSEITKMSIVGKGFMSIPPPLLEMGQCTDRCITLSLTHM